MDGRRRGREPILRRRRFAFREPAAPRVARGAREARGATAPRPPRPGPAAKDRPAPRRRAASRRGFARIADRDHHIAQESRMADSLDRTAGEPGAKTRIVEARKLGERRRLEIVAGGELRLASSGSELVPRADREAIVAAVDPIADTPRETPRANWPLVLDREVGNAAPRVELIGAGKGRGRADVEAGAAGSAMIASRLRRRADRDR